LYKLGITSLIINETIKTKQRYTVKILSIFALFLTNFDFVFKYSFSSFLLGRFKIYAMIKPAINGVRDAKMFPKKERTFVILSKVLYTAINAAPSTNIIIHFVYFSYFFKLCHFLKIY